MVIRSYDLVDADSHVLEPVDMWPSYVDPAFRERAPRVVTEDGQQFMVVDGQAVGKRPAGVKINPANRLGMAGGVGARDGKVDENITYEEGRRGGFDPHARIGDMDIDGIDATFLYPTLGLGLCALNDAPLAAAVCRAYNRWLADYCSAYPERLFGVAMLPMASIELAIEELCFAWSELGFCSVMLRPNPVGNRTLHHPDYAPLWNELEELDVSLSIHASVSAPGANGPLALESIGIERFEGTAARHIVSHTIEMMLAALSMIFEGVCDRHPRLRVGFLEAGGGWMPGWLDRMDRHFEDQCMNDSGLTMRPSELFERNCWISFEPVESTLDVLADHLGPHKILWATDYPHVDGFFPGAPNMIAKRPLTPETKRIIFAESAKAFYGLRHG